MTSSARVVNADAICMAEIIANGATQVGRYLVLFKAFSISSSSCARFFFARLNAVSAEGNDKGEADMADTFRESVLAHYIPSYNC